MMIDNIKRRIRSKNIYKNFFMFIMGCLIAGISVSVFYNPNNVVTTGCTGLSILINRYTHIDLSLIVLVFSSILLVIGFMVFGVEYGIKNILGTILFPIFIKATSIINNYVSFENTSLFLLILIGSVLSGISFGMIKKSGYSLGGFYVVYDLLNSKFKISVGKASLFTNIVIIILSSFVFGIDNCIYAAIGLYITAYIGDKIMLGISSNKAFYIVTSKYKAVREYIINDLNHTVTIVNAKGGYSDKGKKMLLCVVSTTEYIKMRDVIKEIDKDAFFLITDSYSVANKI